MIYLIYNEIKAKNANVCNNQWKSSNCCDNINSIIDEINRKNVQRSEKHMTPAKERALQALLTEKDKKTAATAAGISYRTILNYMNDAEFMTAYDAAYGKIITNATRTAQRNMESALDVLKEIADNKAETGAARVAAARATLEYSLKLTEMHDVLKFIGDDECIMTD